MTQTIAEALREEGFLEGLRRAALRTSQDILLSLLRTKFQRVPKATEKVVRATHDAAQLDAWLSRVLTASTLEDMGIGV